MTVDLYKLNLEKIKTSKMKLTQFITAFVVFTTLIVVSHNRTIEEIQNIGINQHKIDSLKHEIDFRDDMILKFIENNETDPIGVRVEVKKEGR